MADATPKAEELAQEKGVDLDNVKGTGKDGRVLVEDVEAAVEAREADAEAGKDVTRAESGDESAEAAESRRAEFLDELESDKREQVGKPEGEVVVGGDMVESAEKSADAMLEHPHVPLEDQSDVEKADLLAAEDQVQLPGEEAPEVEEEPAEESEASAAAAKAAEEGESDDPDPELLLSQEDILSRGERERGFYVIPEQVNPIFKAEQERLAAEEEEVSASEGDSKKSAEEPANVLDSEDARPAQQEGVVDTSDAGGSPTGGESLVDKSPAVAEVAEGRDEPESRGE